MGRECAKVERSIKFKIESVKQTVQKDMLLKMMARLGEVQEFLANVKLMQTERENISAYQS